MLRPTVPNIILFWFVKYIAFYIIMMFKTDNFAFIKVSEIKNGEDLFYYLWIFLFLPVVASLLLTTPLYFSFKVKNIMYFILIVGIILFVEYFGYTYSSSTLDFTNGIYNGILSVLFLLFLFFRHISTLYHQ